MEWATPQFSHEAVDAAGVALVDPTSSDGDVTLSKVIVNNWRSSHHYPLNTFQMALRARARSVDDRSIVAQRIKRLSSIEAKLRKPKPKLTLTEMQDIGGCRAIVSSVNKVSELVTLYKTRPFKHELVHEDNYILRPKKSGYRGVHLIYRHRSKRTEYDGLKVEMQFRSELQHAWATTVETVGLFTKQALKSSQGETDWLRFFLLMSSEMALREKQSNVPGAPSTRIETRTELRGLVSNLRVEERLAGYKTAIDRMGGLGKDAHFFLVSIDPVARLATVRGYRKEDSEAASKEYLRIESDRPGVDAVLVSADSVGALKRAYPNYFADTSKFVVALRFAVVPRF